MAFFSNGTEGEAYEHNVCSRCAHYSDDDESMCSVWGIHLLHNGADGEAGQILDLLIPRQGIYNDLCTMYHPSKPEYADHGKNYQEWLREKGK